MSVEGEQSWLPRGVIVVMTLDHMTQWTVFLTLSKNTDQLGVDRNKATKWLAIKSGQRMSWPVSSFQNRQSIHYQLGSGVQLAGTVKPRESRSTWWGHSEISQAGKWGVGWGTPLERRLEPSGGSLGSARGTQTWQKLDCGKFSGPG